MSVFLPTSLLPNLAYFNEICALRDPAVISRQFETGAMPQDLSNCDFPRNKPSPVLRIIQSFSVQWMGIYGRLDNGQWRQDLRTSVVRIEEDTRQYDITIMCLDILFKHNIGKNKMYSREHGAICVELVDYPRIAGDQRWYMHTEVQIPDFLKYFVKNGLDLSKDTGVWGTSPLRKAVYFQALPIVEFLAYNGAFLPESVGSEFVKGIDRFHAIGRYVTIVEGARILYPCRICKEKDAIFAMMGRAIFINCLIRLRMSPSSPFPEHLKLEGRSFTKKILPEIQLQFKNNVLPDVFTIRGVNDIIGSYFTDTVDPLSMVKYCEEEAKNLELLRFLLRPHKVNGWLNKNAIVISHQILFDAMLKKTITVQDLFDVGLIIDEDDEDDLTDPPVPKYTIDDNEEDDSTEDSSLSHYDHKKPKADETTKDSLTRLPREPVLPIGLTSQKEPEPPKGPTKSSKRRNRRKQAAVLK